MSEAGPPLWLRLQPQHHKDKKTGVCSALQPCATVFPLSEHTDTLLRCTVFMALRFSVNHTVVLLVRLIFSVRILRSKPRTFGIDLELYM